MKKAEDAEKISSYAAAIPSEEVKKEKNIDSPGTAVFEADATQTHVRQYI